ncbi:MAG TPA: hypothetical protein VHY84_01455 [Bryobacteraceae bacterium]|jgi:hypothetical protein|nr:hypothetical protein [Bryobacteraceae bacterium]
MKKTALSVLGGAALALLLTIPAAAAGKANQRSVQAAWPSETLGGTIGMVEPNQKMLVVETPGNVPFDIVVTPKTRIMHNNQAVTVQDLSQYKNSHVTVHFVPEKRGDVAESIRING